MLVDYFKLNLEDEDARQYFYKDIPCHYVYKKEKIDGINVSKWETRKKVLIVLVACILLVQLNTNFFTYGYYYCTLKVPQVLIH